MFAFPIALAIAAEAGILSTKHLNTLTETPGSIINVKFFCSAILAAVYFANYKRGNAGRNKLIGFLLLIGVAYSAIGFYSGYMGRLGIFFWIFIVLAGTKRFYEIILREKITNICCLAIYTLYFILYFGVLGFSQVVPYDIILII